MNGPERNSAPVFVAPKRPTDLPFGESALLAGRFPIHAYNIPLPHTMICPPSLPSLLSRLSRQAH